MRGVGWPAGHKGGFALTFDVDAESAILAMGPAYAGRLSTMSHQAYGPKVGVPRILQLLERHHLRATFFIPGLTADRYPGVVEKIAAAGHEIGHHGYSHVPFHSLSQDRERQELERGLAALERITGTLPRGFRAPWWELTERTPALLAEYGFEFDSSLMDDDRPYLLDTGRGLLAELPVHWMLDDWEQYAFLPEPNIGSVIESPAKALELWRLELDALVDDEGLFILTCHPFISGRPSRVRALDQLIEHARARRDVWFASLGEIAAYVHATLPASQARPLSLVRIEEGVYV
jgi:peptidoglycan/xylan/chitin deacetylase (PgdA/CDA1 family)